MTELAVKGPALTVIGAGAMATTLSAALAAGGARVGVWARRPEAASRLAVRLQGVEAFASLRRALSGAEAALVCVSDDAIEAVAGELAAAGAALPCALHVSGFHGNVPLAALALGGSAVGSLHPLLSAPPDTARGGEIPSLAGCWFALQGDAAAVALARRLVTLVGGRELRLGEAERAKRGYHTAAALLSNGAVALFDAALELLAEAGSSPAEASQALAWLLRGTAERIAARGVPEALTGPASRGDAGVVSGHLEELAGRPGALAVYRELTRRMLAMAATRGSLDPAHRREIEALLDAARAPGE